MYPNFNKSLQTGQVPNDWKEANVAPIFKKGDKHNPCNYRPISLTCIISKCMKPIIVSNITQHLNSNKILYALQRLYADDCILYRSINTERDSTLLQTDLNSQRELTWQTKFKIDKCYTMQAGRKRHTILNTYTLHDHPIPITDSAKYLGITISNDLKWNKHVSNITSKANSTLGILRRNPRLRRGYRCGDSGTANTAAASSRSFALQALPDAARRTSYALYGSSCYFSSRLPVSRTQTADTLRG